MPIRRLSPANARRPILAFLLAPLAAPVTYLAVATAFGGFVSSDLALVIAQSAYVVALIGGVPLHVALGRLGWVTLHDYLVFGFLLGGLAALAGEHAPLAFSALLQAGLAALYGTVAGALFWLIARPDRRTT
jgi:hypothetical protein